MRDLMELRDFNYTSRPSSLLFPRISVFPSCLCASFEHRFFSSRLLFVSDEEETVFVITDWWRAGKTSWFASLKRWNINPKRERFIRIPSFFRRNWFICAQMSFVVFGKKDSGKKRNWKLLSRRDQSSKFREC